MILIPNGSLLRVTTSAAGNVRVNHSTLEAPSPITPTSNFTPVPATLAAITTATTTTVVAGPASGVIRNVREISVHNAASSTANTVTVEVFDGTNAATKWAGTLQAGERVSMDSTGAWSVYTVDGVRESAVVSDPIGVFVAASADVTLAAVDVRKRYATGATSRAFTVPQNLGDAFLGVTVDGPCTWVAGSGVTINDSRSTGAAYSFCQLVQTAPNVYRVVGAKP